MTWFVKILLSVFFSIIFVFPISGSAQTKSDVVHHNFYLPNLSLTEMSGNVINMKNLEGKILVINLWANWCPVCHHETPWFVQLHRRLGPAVRFVGIAIDNKDSAKHFIMQEKINYLTLLAEPHPGRVMAMLGDKAGMLPYTLVVAPNGRILLRHLGSYPAAQLLTDIRRIQKDYANVKR